MPTLPLSEVLAKAPETKADAYQAYYDAPSNETWDHYCAVADAEDRAWFAANEKLLNWERGQPLP